MSEAHILVVDDEPKLVHLVREILSAAGFTVVAASQPDEAIEKAALEQPDLILLDIIFSGPVDGYEIARRVREFSNVPIIMLTAKARETDVLRGFDAGADDYLAKPFSSKELLARVRAVLKRARHEPAALTQVEIVCPNLRIDLARRRVTVNGHEVSLTPTEYKLLHELAAHRNQVMLHEQLLTAVWGPEYRNDVDYLRAYIRYLRRKLEPDPANPKFIVTSPGAGYMLACPENDPD